MTEIAGDQKADGVVNENKIFNVAASLEIIKMQYLNAPITQALPQQMPKRQIFGNKNEVCKYSQIYIDTHAFMGHCGP